MTFLSVSVLTPLFFRSLCGPRPIKGMQSISFSQNFIIIIIIIIIILNF
jgi:hypothetical protein